MTLPMTREILVLKTSYYDAARKENSKAIKITVGWCPRYLKGT